MASFNLGKIKGDKGEKGDIGPKGEKGEKGDRGEKGTDGNTPVFSIAQTQTLGSGEDAYVELDSTDIQNPVLKFFIPKGKDGNDAIGDMQSALYDKNDRKTDVYEFAENLFESTFKKEGGIFTGQVKAYISLPQDICVRNICISNSLPNSAQNGDICVLLKRESDITLADVDIGKILLIKEEDSYHEYIVVARDTYSEKGTVLIRKNLLKDGVLYDKNNRSYYSQSDLDTFLNTIVFQLFDENVKSNMLSVSVEQNTTRRVFVPSTVDISNLSGIEGATTKTIIDDGESAIYWTRRREKDGYVFCVDADGYFVSLSANQTHYVRPMIVLSSDLQVQNVDVQGGIGYKISEEKSGIYNFKDGEWSECKL